MKAKLETLLGRLKDEQQRLLFAAAEIDALPSNSTLDRVAQIELTIAALEHTLENMTG